MRTIVLVLIVVSCVNVLFLLWQTGVLSRKVPRDTSWLLETQGLRVLNYRPGTVPRTGVTIRHVRAEVPQASDWTTSSRSSGEVTSSSLDKRLYTLEEADNATMFYNVSARMFQPLWTWPQDEKGRRVQGRELLVVIYNYQSWLRVKTWNEAVTARQCYLPCHFSTDVTKLNDADAIIFLGNSLKSKPPPQLHRPPGQVWLWMSLEPPAKLVDAGINGSAWHHAINWTLTYRRDSDVYFPYQRFQKRSSSSQLDVASLVSGKKKLAAWVVSNCHSRSKRMQYFKELQKHLSVDVFGRCGSLKCNGSCWETVAQYKFYLSFENSLCRDYVSEKVYNYMKHSFVVPVVRGGADYSHFLPEGSYISTAQFSTPGELAKFLRSLDRNPAAYAKYHEWRRTLEITELTEAPSCDVCTRLLRPERHKKTYDNVWPWWYQGQCF